MTIIETLNNGESGLVHRTKINDNFSDLNSGKVETTTTINGKALNTNITLDKTDIGLSNVENTSDLNKPISTATQNALDLKRNISDSYSQTETNTLLDGKVDKVSGKELSENDFTDVLKTKLDNIEAGAEVNTLNDVIAGTNITIDKTDPLNPVISSTASGGATDFIDLGDVPASYTGQAGKFTKVNATEDGLEFATIPGGGVLLSTNNLSDLANITTARDNLDVYSTTEVDTALDLKQNLALTNLVSTNLNTIVTNGKYCAVATCSNLPESGVKTRLIVNVDPTNSDLAMQEALTTTTQVSYVRTTTNGGSTWTAWARIKATDETKVSLAGTQTIQDFNNKALNGNTLKIVCIGDSITFGLEQGTASTQVATPYPLELQNKLRTFYKNNNITVVNKGVSGRYATDLISNYTSDVVNEAPDLVIQMIGINDSNNSTTIDNFYNSIKTLAKNAKDNDFPTIFVTSTPIRRESTQATKNNYRLSYYRKVVKDVASLFTIPVVDMEQEFNSLINGGGYSIWDFVNHSTDELHPDQDGYILVADIIAKNIITGTSIIEKGEFHIPLVSSLNTYSSNIGTSDIYKVSGNEYITNYILRKNTPGKYVMCPIYIGVKGLSLYANSCKNTAGTTAGIRDNGTTGVYSINFYHGSLVANIKDLLDSNLSIGLHILEFNSDDFAGGDLSTAQWYPSAFEIKDNNIVQTGAITTSGLTQSTNKLLGRSTASTGAVEEITLGTNLSFTGTTLNATGGGITADETVTLTNKRITSRVTTITSSGTPTVNTDNCDAVTITAQAENITNMTTNLSGTPTNFQKLIYRIKDNGTARTIAWGTSFVAMGMPLPTTTVISKVLTVGFIYDTVNSKWGCVASAQE